MCLEENCYALRISDYSMRFEVIGNLEGRKHRRDGSQAENPNAIS
jgi:hypothetical protein